MRDRREGKQSERPPGKLAVSVRPFNCPLSLSLSLPSLGAYLVNIRYIADLSRNLVILQSYSSAIRISNQIELKRLLERAHHVSSARPKTARKTFGDHFPTPPTA